MKTLVTGAAGFIGFHVSRQLLERGDEVVGVDSLNDYYDVELKKTRQSVLEEFDRFELVQGELSDRSLLKPLFEAHGFDRVIHLAAQAGVRHSLTHPEDYIDSNLIAFGNILEACRHAETAHLTYASSSSVYGGNSKMPFAVEDNVDHPLSLYAATKKANELMAHSYSHLFGLPSTGLRFFTVYGPWGRPDMAMWLFADAIRHGKPLKVFNHGEMMRDFTFIDDIAEGVIRTSDAVAAPNPDWSAETPDPSTSKAPYRLYNIGNHSPTQLMHVIRLIETHMGREAQLEMLPMQPGDVPASFADVDALSDAVGFRPDTTIEDGIAQFIDWFRWYHDIDGARSKTTFAGLSRATRAAKKAA